MADGLDAAIDRAREEWASAKAQADDWARRAELLHMRVQALEDASRLRPVPQEAPRAKTDAGGSRGRQPGAISKQWRKVLLASAAKYPDGASETELADLARMEGLHTVRPRDVRGRMADYEGHGYVQPAPNGWRVTPYAISKFGSETAQDGSDSMEDEAEMETADAA